MSPKYAEKEETNIAFFTDPNKLLNVVNDRNSDITSRMMAVSRLHQLTREGGREKREAAIDALISCIYEPSVTQMAVSKLLESEVPARLQEKAAAAVGAEFSQNADKYGDELKYKVVDLAISSGGWTKALEGLTVSMNSSELKKFLSGYVKTHGIDGAFESFSGALLTSRGENLAGFALEGLASIYASETADKVQKLKAFREICHTTVNGTDESQVNAIEVMGRCMKSEPVSYVERSEFSGKTTMVSTGDLIVSTIDELSKISKGHTSDVIGKVRGAIKAVREQVADGVEMVFVNLSNNVDDFTGKRTMKKTVNVPEVMRVASLFRTVGIDGNIEEVRERMEYIANGNHPMIHNLAASACRNALKE